MHPVRVVANRELGGGYYLLTLESPFGPEAVRPGQFVMLRAPGRLDPLLPRAFAIFDIRAGADGDPPTIEFFYHIIGKTTRLMAGLTPGDELEVLGPLGNSFTVPRATRRAVIVAGGVDLVINTTHGKQALKDSYTLRRTALSRDIIYTTTIWGAEAMVKAIRDLVVGLEDGTFGVRSLQEHHGGEELEKL